MPGLADSIPYLMIGGVCVAYGVWLEVSRTVVLVGGLPLTLPILGVGGVLLVGGFLGAFLGNEDRDSPPGESSDTETFQVPRTEWLEMKAQLAALRAEPPRAPERRDVAPWDEGPVSDLSAYLRVPGSAPEGHEAQDAIQELETLERELQGHPDRERRSS